MTATAADAHVSLNSLDQAYAHTHVLNKYRVGRSWQQLLPCACAFPILVFTAIALLNARVYGDSEMLSALEAQERWPFNSYVAGNITAATDHIVTPELWYKAVAAQRKAHNSGVNMFQFAVVLWSGVAGTCLLCMLIMFLYTVWNRGSFEALRRASGNEKNCASRITVRWSVLKYDTGHISEAEKNRFRAWRKMAVNLFIVTGIVFMATLLTGLLGMATSAMTQSSARKELRSEDVPRRTSDMLFAAMPTPGNSSSLSHAAEVLNYCTVGFAMILGIGAAACPGPDGCGSGGLEIMSDADLRRHRAAAVPPPTATSGDPEPAVSAAV